MRLSLSPLRAASVSLALVGLAVALPAAHAQSTIYTNSASFLANVQAGSYTETFTGTNQEVPSASFLSNGYGYTVTGGGTSPTVYLSGTFIGSNRSSQPLTFTFTTGNVTAIGGNFFVSDIADNVVSAPVTITLSDGTITTFTSDNALTYRGFTSNVAITSLVISAPGAGLYSNVDNLTVGTRVVGAAAPEPGTLALVGAGAIPLMGMVARRRRIKSA